MTLINTKEIDCQCGERNEMIVYQSVNISNEPALLDALERSTYWPAVRNMNGWE